MRVSKPYTKLIVIGGRTPKADSLGSRLVRAIDMEKISLCDVGSHHLKGHFVKDETHGQNNTETKLPGRLLGAKGVFYDGHPIICGGLEGTDKYGGSPISSNCYRILKDDQWVDIPNMRIKRKSHSMAVLSDRIIVAGGIETEDDYGEGDPFLNSIETFQTDEGWKIMNITMPKKMMGHCFVTLPDDRVISIGGYAYDFDFNDFYYDETWILNVKNQSWEKQSPMIERRAYHGCATITDLDENVFVIVSGGETDNGKRLSTSEVYDIANNTWSLVASLPKSLSKAQLIEDRRGGVLMVGGDDGSKTQSSSDIFYLPTKNGDWMQTFKSLDVSSSDHVSMLVPDSLIEC